MEQHSSRDTLYHEEVIEVHAKRGRFDSDNNGKEKKYKWAVRKMDLYFLWFLPMLYFWDFLNRVNIGHAKLFNLKEDLQLDDNKYSLCLSLFFIGYVLFEVPSNMMMKKYGPRVWMTILTIGWGATSLAMGFVQNFSQLLALRIVLGTFEAGLFPGIVAYLKGWYRKRELTSRISVFCSAAAFAGGIGGLLAYGIYDLDGKAGYAAWRWIFIIEALPTLLLGFLCFWYLPDDVQSAIFLNQEEKKLVNRKRQPTNTSEIIVHEHQSHGKLFVKVLFKPITIPFMIMNLLGLLPVYALSYATPSIIKGLGWSGVEAQLLSAPPYLIATAGMIIIALDADRRGYCWKHVVIAGIFNVISFLILAIFHKNAPVSYVFVYIAAISSFANLSLVIAWASHCFKDEDENVVGVALVSSLGNMGGVAGGFLYASPDVYARDHWIIFAICVVLVVDAVSMQWYLERQQKTRREKAHADELRQPEVTQLGGSVTDKISGMDIRQRQPSKTFVYE